MITRMISAGVRAFLVSMLIALPALMLPGVAPDTTQIIALLSLLAALLTFVEYVSSYPSLIEFRDAPPFNRMRFIALLTTILMLTLVSRGSTDPSALTDAVTGFGAQVGAMLDFPFSPVRLMLLILPQDAPLALQETLRIHAGLAYMIATSSTVVVYLLIRYLVWPLRNGAFNFWVNLPLFDPTAGGDVLYRLRRDANINVALGFLLPFLIPAVLKAASELMNPIGFADPQTMIWTITSWAFLPASLIMRGVALLRIADLIEEKRRRAYAQAELQIA
ncbi:hypothetical protein ACOXXX_15680 [Thalassococcus sp. BH17M4-6]|uniref:hypothetical protein n=1 Tax=Thalassococcus sp. BH17M4-6 TaxID=3413148 RepID=UPI003BDEA877